MRVAERCYKPEWPLDEVLKAMKEGSGSHFAPELLQHRFIDNSDVFTKVKVELSDENLQGESY